MTDPHLNVSQGFRTRIRRTEPRDGLRIEKRPGLLQPRHVVAASLPDGGRDPAPEPYEIIVRRASAQQQTMSS